MSRVLASTTGSDLCFVFCSPEGPSTPFGSPLLVVLDVARIICLIVGIMVVVSAPRAMLQVGHWGQACRFAALAAFCLVAIDTRLEHMGDYTGARMLVDLTGTLLAAAGVWSFFYCDDDGPPRGAP